MIKSKQRLLKLQYMIMDLFILQICNMLCGHVFKKILHYQIASSLKGSFFNIAVSVFCILAFIVFNIYNDDIKSKGNSVKKFFKLIIIICTSTALSELAVRIVNNNKGMGERFLLAFAITSIALLIVGRLLMPIFVKSVNDTHGAKILFVGSSPSIRRYYDYIHNNDFMYGEIIGYVDTEQNEAMQSIGVDYIGNLDNINNLVVDKIVDKVIVDHFDAEDEKIKKFILMCRNMGIVVIVTLEPFLDELKSWNKVIISDVPAVRYSVAKLNSGQLFLKRVIDVIGSIVGLFILLISFIIFAPLIKLESKGPVFFKQTRVGKNGRRFGIFKYRTMYNDAEARKKELMKNNKMSGHMFKMDDDPRVTKIGKILRKTSIDELPQFINVFLGDMSLVGTRPPTVEEVSNYENHHFIRLSVTPGITGNWQVNGRSDISDFEEVVRLDEEYIVNWTIWEDIRIILKTVRVIFRRKGAY